MEQGVLAKYSLELLDGGKYRVEIDWGNLTNSQLHTFTNAIIDPPDALNVKIKDRMKNLACYKHQEQIVTAFLTKNDKYRARANSTVFKSDEIARYHFLQSQHQFITRENDE